MQSGKNSIVIDKTAERGLAFVDGLEVIDEGAVSGYCPSGVTFNLMSVTDKNALKMAYGAVLNGEFLSFASRIKDNQDRPAVQLRKA